MRLPRLTTRRLMVLVAVAALPLVLFAELRRRQNGHARLVRIYEQRLSVSTYKAVYLRGDSRRYHDKAKGTREHATFASSVASAEPKTVTVNRVEVSWGEIAVAHANDAREFELQSGQFAREARENERLADYYRVLSSKYRNTARYPWLLVPPDPPPPK